MNTESSDRLPPAYPFAAADMDIEMIDKLHAGQNGSSSTPPTSAAVETGDPVGMARQLADAILSLVQRLDEAETHGQELEVRHRHLEMQMATERENAAASESVARALREAASTPLTDDDLQALERVLQGLTQDPNHIMVLASVAQQAQKLLIAVTAFNRLHVALQQTPPS